MNHEQRANSQQQGAITERQTAVSHEQIVQLESKHAVWPMYRAMVGIGLVCAIILVTVFRFTAPTIQHNRQQLLYQSIYQLFPHAHGILPFSISASGILKLQTTAAENPQFYGVYNSKNKLLGVAIKVTTPGYQDTLQFLYAYRPSTQTLNGYQILESRETPGLGSRIETDKAFRDNFKQLPVPLSNSRNTLLHPLTVVKHGRKHEPWQIDTISGATISSRALAEAVAHSTAQWIPKLKQLQTQLEQSHAQ